MGTTDELIERNAAYAESFADGGLPAAPGRKLAVLTCMDARIDVFKMLGLEIGDAHVIRNAGGLATEDALRSLTISHHLLGTEELVVIHHTNCGMVTMREEDVKKKIKAETGTLPPFSLGAHSDLEEGLRRAVSDIEDASYISFKTVRGFIYDVATGRLEESGS